MVQHGQDGDEHRGARFCYNFFLIYVCMFSYLMLESICSHIHITLEEEVNLKFQVYCDLS